jgi:lipopolysaccharide/colanic/teichoic acid biosynthesis glycosyltransferase
MLLVAILIMCESNGPALYRQERVGSKGSRFTVKVSQHEQDAEPEGKPVWASPAMLA